MPYTLSQAAIACGVNKSTIFRAVRAGRISAQRDANGQYQIEPVELHRTFPPLPAPATLPVALPPPPLPLDAMTNMLISELRNTVEEMRRARDKAEATAEQWRVAFETTQRLLAAPVQPDAAAPKRRWWRRAG